LCSTSLTFLGTDKEIKEAGEKEARGRKKNKEGSDGVRK
jgi:hypothetical protein